MRKILAIAAVFMAAVAFADSPPPIGIQTLFKNSPKAVPDGSLHFVGVQNNAIKQLSYSSVRPPIATTTSPGIVSIGSGLAIDGNGVLTNTGVSGVSAFNGRTGSITPQAGDYTAGQVGADPAGTSTSTMTIHTNTYAHGNIPSNLQKAALAGTSGTPGGGNLYVTDQDTRMSNARTPLSHAGSHGSGGSDPITLAESQVTGLVSDLAGKQATLSNSVTLGKITESGNLPLWNGAAWPGGAGGGDMYKATYDPQAKNADAFNRANHTGTQPANTVSGLSASATTDTTTTANITDSLNKRFVTDAQRSVLINTSNANSGDVTLGTTNGLSLSGQQLSLQAATNAQPGALTAADHTTYSNAASQASTALQPTSNLDATKLVGTAGINTTGSASSFTGNLSGDVTGTQSTTTVGKINGATIPISKVIVGTNSAGQLVDAGTLPVANGGTGAANAATARTNLGAAPIDNPTFTTGATSPVFTSNAADGTHYVQPYNSVTFSGTPSEGMLRTASDGHLYQYHGSAWQQQDGGSGTWAPLASPAFTGTPTAPTATAGTNTTQIATTAFVTAAVASGGGGTGTIGGSTGGTDRAVLIANGTGGSTLQSSGVTIDTNGIITTPQSATGSDYLALRPASGNGTSAVKVTVSNGAVTPWSFTLPTTLPSDGCVNITGGVLGSTGSACGTSGGGITSIGTSTPTSITGLLKGNGTTVSAAVSGTDFAPATSGVSLLYGNGSGGFSNVTIGSNLTFSGGTLSATGGSGSGTVNSGTTGQFAYYSANGTAVAGRTLVAGDIPSLAESQITNLTTDLAAKASAANPSFTGVATIPAVNFGAQSIVTAGGDVSFSSATPYFTVFTGSQTASAKLPGATILANGRRFHILNQSTQTIYLKDFGSTILSSIASGSDVYATLMDNSSSNGTWAVTGGASGGGSGTVSSSTTGNLAYYAGNGTTVSGTTALPNGTTATTQSAGDNSTNVATTAYVDRAATPTLQTGSGSIGASSKQAYIVCTGNCTVTPYSPPVAGAQLCVRNAPGGSYTISIPAGGYYIEKPDHSGYGTTSGSLSATASTTNEVCLVGLDLSHWLIMNAVGTWTGN